MDEKRVRFVAQETGLTYFDVRSIEIWVSDYLTSEGFKGLLKTYDDLQKKKFGNNRAEKLARAKLHVINIVSKQFDPDQAA